MCWIYCKMALRSLRVRLDGPRDGRDHGAGLAVGGVWPEV